MAKFIERSAEDENDEYSSLGPDVDTGLEEQPQQVETPEEPEVETEQDEEIPDKYQGKSIAEIVRMHQEAEKLVGRQSSEVGELRKIVDDFVKTQLDQQKQSPQAQEEVDLFDDPDAYIERKLASHPKLKEVEQYTMQAKQAQVASQLEANHPDYRSIVADEAFGKWIEASKIRQQLFLRAHEEFDYDSADELLTLWKERQEIVKHTESVQKQDRKNQAKAASTSSAKGSGEPSSKKIYRRADIIELMKTNPKRYQQLHDEIMLAYAEKRVR